MAWESSFRVGDCSSTLARPSADIRSYLPSNSKAVGHSLIGLIIFSAEENAQLTYSEL